MAQSEEMPSSRFSLAPPAGVDSHADRQAPPGAVNTGAFDRAKWVYGHAYDAPAGSKLWNPVMVKMKQGGGTVTAGTIFSATDPNTYCSLARAGYDFVWTEMQHSALNWNQVATMWAQCPHAKAVPGVRVAFANEREEQHALDAGALVLSVPTIDSAEEAREAVKWAFFPPLGSRSTGGGPAFSEQFWGGVPGGYRNTINDNLVLILMIETLDGIRDADKIAATPGVTAIYAATGDLGNFSGYRSGQPDFERLVNIVHDSALRAHKTLCGPMTYRGRPDFTCLWEGNEQTAIGRDVRARLGGLIDTQGKPEVGPFATRPAQ
jgi:2-keto-3-deoxy-L-rhamnonate aldolase RhmA